MKKKLVLGLAASVLLVSTAMSVSAAPTGLDENFTYIAGEELVVDKNNSNYNVYNISNGITATIEEDQNGDGYLRMSTAGVTSTAALSIRDNAQASSLYNDPKNSTLVIKIRTRVANLYRKNIRLYFLEQDGLGSAATLNLFSLHSGTPQYNLGGKTVNLPAICKKDKWMDFTFILADEGGAGEDKVYAYLDGSFVYSDNIDAKYNYQGKLSELNFQVAQAGPEANWDVDYVKIEPYAPNNSTTISPKEVNSGDVFTYEPTLTSNAFDKSYTVTTTPDNVLAYNKDTKQFTANAVQTNTPVKVKFDYTDPLIKDVEGTVTVKPATGEILPAGITQKVFQNDITLNIGQEFNLSDLFEVTNAAATNKTLNYQITGAADVVSITDNKLKALKAGTTTLKVTAAANQEVTIDVNIKVNKGNYSDLDSVTSDATWNSKDITNGDYISKEYNNKTYAPISVVGDPIYGNVFKFSGVGVNNASASHLDRYVNTDLLEANKDYKLSGWAKLDVPAGSTGSGKIDIKLYGYNIVTRNYDYKTQAPYYGSTSLDKAALSNGWVYFETTAINLDTTRIDGIKIEVGAYNLQANMNAYVTNLAFIEQDTINTTGYEVLVDGTTVTNETVINKTVGAEFDIVKHSIPSAGTVDLTFTSSDETIATVDPNGKVTILNKSGTVTITVLNSTKNTTFTLNVGKPVTEITADETNIEVSLSNRVNSYQLTMNPVDATSTLSATSANSAICTAEVVNGRLYIVPVAVGTTTVRVVSSDDETVYLDFTITVKEGKTTNITLDRDNATIEKGQNVTINATTTPSGKTVTYTSSDATIATVTATGVVTGLKAGTTTITVTSDEITKTFTVTVIVKTTGITVAEKEVNLKVDDSYDIRATLSPADSTEGFTYSSSNEDVITVDSNGKVKAIGSGTATVTITSGGITQTITFNVASPTNVVAIIVPIVIVLVLILTGGLAYFFIRKRK